VQEVKPTEVFDGKGWHDAADIPVPGDHLAAVSDGRYLYAIGGRTLDASANHKALQRFDPASGKWAQLPSLPAANSDMGAAYVGGQLITFGGENAFSVFRTAQSFNLATKTWSTLPNMAEPRHGMGVAVVGKTIYAIDGASQPGHNGSTPTMQTLAVSVAPPAVRTSGGWRLGRFSEFPVQQLPAAVLHGRIWLAGGLTGAEQATNKTEYYDTTLHQWAPGPNLPFEVHHAMLVNYRGQLWVIGGFLPRGQNMEAAASARVLILKGGRWVNGPALHHARAAGAAAVVGTRLSWLAGGPAAGRCRRSSPRRFSTARAGTTPPISRSRVIIWRRYRMAGTCTRSAGGLSMPRPTIRRCSGSTRRPGSGPSCRRCRPRTATWARRMSAGS
jgi:non-specific serine/threonine protein kinase